jgi:predicted DNA-binding antitoxin AbrB/MazE fold protein
MATVVEAVYENGVLKPLAEAEFKEQQRYKVLVEEPAPESAPLTGSASSTNDLALDEAKAEKPRTDFTLEMHWLAQHRREYPGEYVALDGDRLVSHGVDGRAVYRQAQAAGVAHPFMAHIEPADALPFGGW